MPEPKRQTKSRGIAYRLSRLLSERQRAALACRAALKRCGRVAVSFPLDPARCRAVLIILPEEEIEGFHQIPNILALLSFFSSATVTVMCEAAMPVFFRSLPGVQSLVEYDREDRFLYSTVFDAYVRQLAAEGFDACILLEKKPDISLLNLVGQTGAAYRIGYWGAGSFPFLNLTVKQAEARRYLSDSNRVLSQMIGASASRPVRWAVPKEAREDAVRVLRDLKVDPAGRLVGIDAWHFCAAFGTQWTGALMAELAARVPLVRFYGVADARVDEERVGWLQQQGLVVVPALATSRMAALIDQSLVLIAGNSLLFQVANLLRKPVIAVFDAASMDLYCKPADTTCGIAFDGKPDERTIGQVRDRLAAWLAAPPAG